MNIAIVGLGKYGTLLTSHLAKENHDIIVIDTNPSIVEDVINQYDVKGFVGNGASYLTQEDAGIHKFDLLIATTSTDEVNILTCLVAKKLNIKQTIARIRNPEYALQAQTMQRELGISMTINPDLNTATEIFRSIKFPSALTVESFANGKVDLVEMKIESDSLLAGKTLQEINEKYGAKVLFSAVSRGEEVIIPSGNFELKVGDYVYITASSRETSNAFKKLKMLKNKAKTAIIIGGGKITYYLTQMLLEAGIAVKIIEKNKERCKSLAESFPKALVLHGEATNHNLLLSEGLNTADVLVAVTGQDETNIVVSTFAKEEGCKKVITKITNGSYDMILEKTGLECVVEPKELFTTECDILVTDGFTGNMVMKTCEGVAKTIGSFLKEEINKTVELCAGSELFVCVSRGSLSKAIGQGKSNIIRLSREYPSLKIKIKEYDGVAEHSVKLIVKKGT